MTRYFLYVLLLALPSLANATSVKFITTKGDIEVKLYDKEAPVSVENFLRYVADGSYKGSVFHRVIPGFMVQGGGFSTAKERLPSYGGIQNESRNGKKNLRGTISMARTSRPHSASRQFFFNLVDNDFLDGNDQKWGYAVFGEITKGIEVIDEIAKVKTGFGGNLGSKDVPKEQIVIKEVIRLPDFPIVN